MKGLAILNKIIWNPAFFSGMLIVFGVFNNAFAGEIRPNKPLPAKIPLEKPTGRTLGAVMHRLCDQWNPNEDRVNELFSNVKYPPLERFSYENNTVQWSADGLNFEIKAYVAIPPRAAGAYRPDAYANTKNGKGITWGLGHVEDPDAAGPYRTDAFTNTTNGQGIEWGLCHVPPIPEKPFTFFVRFDCGLSQKRT